MPFYEYQCQACGAQVEVLQKINDAPLKKCSACGQKKLVKLVSAPVFRLKGGGWYETDFKTDKDNKRNLVDSDKGESKEAKSEDKGEAKADAKGEAKDAKAEAKSDTKGGNSEVKGESKAQSKSASTSTPASGSASRSKSRPTSTARKPVAKPARAKKSKGRR